MQDMGQVKYVTIRNVHKIVTMSHRFIDVILCICATFIYNSNEIKFA